MYCPTCGIQNSEDNKFCSSCGSALDIKPAQPKTQISSETKEIPIPLPLIATTWILVVLSFFPMGQVSLLISIAILICAIFLISSKNGTGKSNGWFVLVIWSVTFLIGFFGAIAK